MSNVTTIPAYPEDTTGTAVSNKVVGEQQIVLAAEFSQYNFVVPKFAPIFARGFAASIKTPDGQSRALVIGKDIMLSHRFIDASLAQSDDIFGSVTFLNTQLSGVITFDKYQTVGGQWTLDDAAWAAVMANKVHNPRVSSWDSVVNLPVSFPVKDHNNDTNDLTGMSEIKESLDEIVVAVSQQSNTDLGDFINRRDNPNKVTAAQTNAYDRTQTDTKIAADIATAISSHLGSVDAHPQYLTAERAAVLIAVAVGEVRQPKNVTPAAAATNVSQTATLSGNGYYSLYGIAQNAAQFQVSRQQDFAANIVVESGTIGPVQSFAITAGISANAAYFWRCRYRDSEGTWSAWSAATAFSTGSIIVEKPSITDPGNGSTGVSTSPLLKSTAFAVTGGADTHASTDWEIWTGPNGTGTRVLQVLQSSAKLQYQVTAGILSPNIAYYARVRYNATGAGTSAWSNDVGFTTSGLVTKPSITAPANGDVNVGENPTLASSAFGVTGGNDTHASSDWQLWTGANGTGTKVWESLGSTDKVSTVVPNGKLAVATMYYARVRHNGTVLGASAWSNDSSFTTAAVFIPTVAGQAYGGGYYVGRIKEGADTFAIIVSPKASGAINSLPFSNGQATNARSRSDGSIATAAYASLGTGFAPGRAKSLTIAGFSDWYLPSVDELELLYRYLKPTTVANSLSASFNPSGANGVNPSSDPVGAAYTAALPVQTTVTAFKTGGSEELSNILAAAYYASLVPNGGSGANRLLAQYTNDGLQSLIAADAPANWRVIRRVKI